MLRLSKLAGQVTGMKDQVEGYINVDLNPKPKICLSDYVSANRIFGVKVEC